VSKLPEFYKSINYKNPVERAREPVYNPATKYNEYCKSIERMPEPLTTGLPPIKTGENTMKFTMIKTGGFKKTETVS